MMTQPQFATSDILAKLGNISHAFFTRRGGVSQGIYSSLNAGLGSGDEKNKVIENRNGMARALGVKDGQVASPYQVHSDIAVVANEAWSEERPEADGIITNVPGLAVGIVTADCGPVLFADPDARIVGAAHAGWKGALGGVLENTIERMIELGAVRENIRAVLGPTISQKNYEVGPEFPTPFQELDAANQRYFIPSQKDGHHMFDLPAYIVNRLTKSGVRAMWVGLCTYEGDSFFSYRRTTHRGEPDYGRQLSAIALKP